MIKRTVFGVGYNSGGEYRTGENKKITRCYTVWRGMVERCYNPKKLIRRPNYVGCSVDERWLDYQSFAEWYYSHKYSGLGYQLDKDVLVQGNKIYSPETCCFVPREINMLFVSAARARGEFPQGVHYYKPLKKYKAIIRIHGNHEYLGYHNTPEEAYSVYKCRKEAHVKEMADLWFGNIEPRVYEALMDWELES